MIIEINYVLKEDMNKPNYICPKCSCKKPFLKVLPAIQGSYSYEAQKAVCIHCDSPFVGISQKSIPIGLLPLFSKGQCYSFSTDLIDFEDEVFQKANQFLV